MTNIATATGQGPQGQSVLDTDTQTVPFAQNPAIQVVKSQALTTDANTNGLPDVGDVVTYSYVVTNTGDATLSSVALTDDVEGPITLRGGLVCLNSAARFDKWNRAAVR